MKPSLLVTLPLAVAACGPATPAQEPLELDQVASMTVLARDLPRFFPVDGTVEGANRAALSTRLMARVTGLEVEVGDRVRRDQVLVRLGTEDIAVNRTKARAAVELATAAQAEAQRHAERMEALFQADAVARVARDQARLGLTEASSQLAMAQAGLREVETADRYAQVSAPFDGVVVRRQVGLGDLAVPGAPLLVVEGTGEREVVLAVPADLAATLTVGQPIVIRRSDGAEAEAPIAALAGGADPATRTVEVRATLPSDWPTGIAVLALVPNGSHRGIAVPVSAVVRRGQLTGVQVVTDRGPVLRWVRLGRTLPGPETAPGQVEIEVVSGLTAGERIAL